MTTTPPVAIIFDYDGVLVNSMPAHVNAWQQAFRRCTNAEIPSAELYSREGESRERTVFDLFKFVSGHAPGPHQTREIIAWRDSYYRAHSTRLFPHVRDLLAGLLKKRVTLAIVSGNVDVVQELKERNLDRFFSVVISPSESRSMKPNPGPYLAAVERLRLPRNRCVVVENSPLGIRAARGAALGCIAVRANSPLTLETLRGCGASVVFRSIADLHAFVEARGRGIFSFVAACDDAMRSRS